MKDSHPWEIRWILIVHFFVLKEFIGHGIGRRNPGRVRRLPQLKIQDWGPRGSRRLEFTRQYHKGEIYTKRELLRSSDDLWVVRGVLISTCVLRSYLTLGKELPEGIRGNSAQWLYEPDWKTSWFMEYWADCSEGP